RVDSTVHSETDVPMDEWCASRRRRLRRLGLGLALGARGPDSPRYLAGLGHVYEVLARLMRRLLIIRHPFEQRIQRTEINEAATEHPLENVRMQLGKLIDGAAPQAIPGHAIVDRARALQKHEVVSGAPVRGTAHE